MTYLTLNLYVYHLRLELFIKGKQKKKTAQDEHKKILDLLPDGLIVLDE